MTDHPARPATFRPTVDVRDLTGELQDIDTLTADVFGADFPLRDRVATLVADWDDTTTVISGVVPSGVEDQVDARARDRRGLS